MGLPESTSVNRFCGQSSLSPSTETNEVVESSENGKQRSKLADEDECLRLRGKLLRRQLKKCRREMEMEMERHLLQLQLMQAEAKRREEVFQLEKEASAAKKAYYSRLLSPNGDQSPRVKGEEVLNGVELSL